MVQGNQLAGLVGVQQRFLYHLSIGTLSHFRRRGSSILLVKLCSHTTFLGCFLPSQPKSVRRTMTKRKSVIDMMDTGEQVRPSFFFWKD